MALSSITILGGDLRQCYAAEYLALQGFAVTCFQTPDFPYSSSIHLTDSLLDALNPPGAVLSPSPLSKDGLHLFQQNRSMTLTSLTDLTKTLSPRHVFFYNGAPAAFLRSLTDTGCPTYNLSRQLEFTVKNARLTAEGLLSEVIRYTPFSIQGQNILLLGFGHCGSAAGPMFSSFGGKVWVLEQEAEKQKHAEALGLLALSPQELNTMLPQIQIVVNTIPAQVLSKDQLGLLPPDCHIFDIASAPFGFPEHTAAEYFLPCFRLPGLPGRFSPQTAGQEIGRTIERMTLYAL